MNARRLWVCVVLGLCLGSAGSAAAVDLTFFGWSDQHVATDGNAVHVARAVAAMNALPGTPYPERLGGTVARPAFVLGAGDLTEWPTRAARDAYAHLVTEVLAYPSIEILGNHDTGGRVPSDTMVAWIRARHGARSFAFTREGIRFLALDAPFDDALGRPDQPLPPTTLRDLQRRLAALPAGVPVVVVLHLCFDAITNRDALLDVLTDHPILAVLGGHYHQAKVQFAQGIPFVQLPSPAPGSPNAVTVFRITADRLLALPYDYEHGRWLDEPGRRLDAPRPLAPAPVQPRDGRGDG